MKNQTKHIAFATIVLIAAAGLSAAADRGGKTLVNVDRSGLAIRGHDPVAYFTQEKPARGDEKITAEHRGATYRFISDEHRKMFLADPDRYAPQFGGYCGYGLSLGYLAPVSPEAFQIIDGRLILQYDRGAMRLFAKDQAGNLAKADTNWPRLVEKHGK